MGYQDKLKPIATTTPSYQAKLKPLTPPAPPPAKKPFFAKAIDATLGAGQAVSDFVGAKGISDQFGADLARAFAPKEAKDLVEYPKMKDVVGSGLQTGSLLLPVGAGAKVATAGLQAAKIPLAGALGKVAAGAGAGAVYDAGSALKGEDTFPTATMIGAAIPGAGLFGKGANKLGEAIAPKMINSLIKPLAKQFSYGKNPGRTVAELGITGNDFDDLAKNIASAKNEVGSRLQTAAQQIPPQTRLDLGSIVTPFDEAITKAVENNDQALVNRLKEARDAVSQVFAMEEGKVVPRGSRILDNLSYEEALDIKRRLGELTKWTGKKTEDETVNGALTRAYGAVKDQLNTAADSVSPGVGANLRKLNEQYADLTSAEISTKYRDVLEKRQNLVNLPGKVGLTLSALAGMTTGGLLPLLGAISSVALDKALSSPAVKTRLAALLAKLPPNELRLLEQQNPTIIETLRKNFGTLEMPGDAFFKAK